MKDSPGVDPAAAATIPRGGSTAAAGPLAAPAAERPLRQLYLCLKLRSLTRDLRFEFVC
jgi:hypothetical protein